MTMPRRLMGLGFLLALLAAGPFVTGSFVAPAHAAEARYYAPPTHVKATLQAPHAGTVLFREATGGFSYDAEAQTLNRVKIALAARVLEGDQTFYRLLEPHLYPELTFVSGPSVAVKDGKANLAGTLSLHGVGKAITMEASVSPATTGDSVRLSLTAPIKLADFGITRDDDSATLLFELQAIKP